MLTNYSKFFRISARFGPELGNDGFRRPKSVHGGGHDPPRVARPFAHGIDARMGKGLHILPPEEAHRGAGPGLHGGQHRVGHVEAPDLSGKGHEPLPKGRRHERRQTRVQIRPHDPRPEGGRDGAEPGSAAAHEEVLQPTGGSEALAASQIPGRLLEALLEGHAVESSPAEVLGGHLDHQGGVGVLPGAIKVAHAVESNMLLELRIRSNKRAFKVAFRLLSITA